MSVDDNEPASSPINGGKGGDDVELCGEEEHYCKCSLPIYHSQKAHECKCEGSWYWEGEQFVAVRFPNPAYSSVLGMDD